MALNIPTGHVAHMDGGENTMNHLCDENNSTSKCGESLQELIDTHAYLPMIISTLPF